MQYNCRQMIIIIVTKKKKRKEEINVENIVMVIIKNLQMNKTFALNNP